MGQSLIQDLEGGVVAPRREEAWRTWPQPAPRCPSRSHAGSWRRRCPRDTLGGPTPRGTGVPVASPGGGVAEALFRPGLLDTQEWPSPRPGTLTHSPLACSPAAPATQGQAPLPDEAVHGVAFRPYAAESRPAPLPCMVRGNSSKAAAGAQGVPWMQACAGDARQGPRGEGGQGRGRSLRGTFSKSS